MAAGQRHPEFAGEDARVNGSKGGIASREARRRKQSIRAVCDAIMSGRELRPELLERLRDVVPPETSRCKSDKGTPYILRDAALIGNIYKMAMTYTCGDPKLMGAALEASRLLIELLTDQDGAVEELDRWGREHGSSGGTGTGTGVIIVPDVDQAIMDAPPDGAQDALDGEGEAGGTIG